MAPTMSRTTYYYVMKVIREVGDTLCIHVWYCSSPFLPPSLPSFLPPSLPPSSTLPPFLSLQAGYSGTLPLIPPTHSGKSCGVMANDPQECCKCQQSTIYSARGQGDGIILHYHDMPAHIYRRDLVGSNIINTLNMFCVRAVPVHLWGM